jgi:hypothetical protein
MGYAAKKTEHSGPKRGSGAYWGYKCEAKKESNRIRRENWKREIRDQSACAESGLPLAIAPRPTGDGHGKSVDSAGNFLATPEQG